MSICEMKDIERAAKAILEVAEKNDVGPMFKNKYEELKPYLNCERLSYCLDKYITSEFDHITAGERGIGRMTTSIPRLGAYYRKQMSNLSTEDSSQFYMLIQDIILRAYLTRPLGVENPIDKPKILKGPHLYELWIPVIYVGVTPFSESVTDSLESIEDSNFSSLQTFLNNHGMEKQKLFSGNTIDEIIFRYLVAGYYLRIVEVDKGGKFSSIKTVFSSQ